MHSVYKYIKAEISENVSIIQACLGWKIRKYIKHTLTVLHFKTSAKYNVKSNDTGKSYCAYKRDESHIDFCTQCVIIKLVWEGYR